MNARSVVLSLIVLVLCTSAAAQTTLTCTTPFQQELTAAGEIRSDADHVLRGVIDVKEENRTFVDLKTAAPAGYICTTRLLRSYHGYRGFSLDPKNLVTASGIASPGPTLRAAVGDKVQLILFNHVDITQFSLTSVGGQGFFGEDCDSSISASTGKQKYPARNNDPAKPPLNPENRWRSRRSPCRSSSASPSSTRAALATPHPESAASRARRCRRSPRRRALPRGRRCQPR